MKQKILDALKTKFEGVKEEVLDRIATKGAKTVTKDEEVTTYVEGVTFQTIIDAEGDRRATDAQKTAVANYEKKHNIKDGKPVETKQESKTEETDPEKPAWVQDLLDGYKSMQDRLDKLDGEKTANSRRGQLDELLKDGSDKLKARYTKNFDRLTFKDDDDFKAWIEDQKADIEADIKAEKAAGGIFTPPKGGGSGVKKEVNPILKKQYEDATANNTGTVNSPVILGMPTAK